MEHTLIEQTELPKKLLEYIDEELFMNNSHIPTYRNNEKNNCYMIELSIDCDFERPYTDIFSTIEDLYTWKVQIMDFFDTRWVNELDIGRRCAEFDKLTKKITVIVKIKHEDVDTDDTNSETETESDTDELDAEEEDICVKVDKFNIDEQDEQDT